MLSKAYGIYDHAVNPNGLLAIASSKDNLISTATILSLANGDWSKSIEIASYVFLNANKKASNLKKDNKLIPGIDLIYEDPLFIDLGSSDFSYSETSPCIDSGNPEQTDPDGSIRDIGANIYNPSIIGDCNNDDSQNVIDIIYNMNNCILEVLLDNCACSDLNQDNEYNILDVVMLVNIILEN